MFRAVSVRHSVCRVDDTWLELIASFDTEALMALVALAAVAVEPSRAL